MEDAGEERRYRRRLIAIFACSLLAGVIGIDWGLPNDNQTWAADALAPMTPLAVAYHVFAENGFNSGYFYFKYPVGHPLLLAALSIPVLAVAYLAGDVTGLDTEYPFGFVQPERYLTTLALVARALSVIMSASLLLILAGIARRIAGRSAAIFTALAAAGSYPLVYYAHTSNVESAVLFWSFLALYAMIRALESHDPRWYWLLGASAAMALSTKEQSAGFFVLLPVVIVAAQAGSAARTGQSRRYLPAGSLAGAIVCAAMLITVNAGFYNPSGFVNRVRFLTHTLPAEVRAKYAAYEFPIDYTTEWTAGDEMRHGAQVLRAVATSLGWPAIPLAAGGLAVMALRHARGLLYLLAPLLGYYVLALRLLKQVEIRYTLPLSMLLVVPVGVALAWLAGRSRAGRIGAALLVVLALVYSGEVLLMLTRDARYRAEAWMSPHLEAGKTAEVYQAWTYLPRWQRTPGVTRPPFEARTPGGLAERAPDFVVLSSKGKEGIMMHPNPDWRDGRGMMLEAAENRRLVAGLESETLGYRRVATFERQAIFPRELITSLDPSITVYARETPPPE